MLKRQGMFARKFREGVNSWGKKNTGKEGFWGGTLYIISSTKWSVLG